MELRCTRPACPRPVNVFADLDDPATLRAAPQKFCMACGMPLILVGRYLPTRLLGQGGFGAAFLARDRYTPAMRPCVVKQFQPSADLNSTQLQVAQSLFEREGQVLEELGNKHPQIPDLLAFFELDVPSRTPGKTDRFFYLTQEYIDGENLEDELARRGPFSETALLEVLTEVLKILDFVHDNNSIHRDIKPSNIMRRRDGRIYLLDFGAVKQVTTANPSGKGSTGIYSMGFAPPEQMRGDVVYPATDLYALGVTCITLLTGKQPNELYDTFSNTWNWRSHAQVSDGLADTLDRMLLPTPSQRFQSARETLEALAASSPPVTPTPPKPRTPRSTAAGGAAAAAAPTPSTSLQPATPASPLPTSPNPPISIAQPAIPTPPLPTPQSAPAPRPAFSLMETLGNAAFTGFEGGLLAIALLSVLGTTILTPLFWLILVGVLVFAQSRRWIERMDLLILGAITLGLVLFFPALRSAVLSLVSAAIPGVLSVAILTALVAVLLVLLFRIVYLIISRIV